MKKSSTHTQSDAIAYCATCDKIYGDAKDNLIGKYFECQEDPKNHTSMVIRRSSYNMWHNKKWDKKFAIGAYIYNYKENRSFSALCGKWFKLESLLKGRSGWFLIFQLFFLLIILFIVSILNLRFSYDISNFIGSVVCGLLSITMIIDILLVNTGVAFKSRYPLDVFRTMLCTWFVFIQIIIAFSIFFLLLRDNFKDIDLNWFKSIYFSFVTITTLGYGDIQIKTEAWWLQFTVILELIVGLYFLVVVFAIITSWANLVPAAIERKPLRDVLESRPENYST